MPAETLLRLLRDLLPVETPQFVLCLASDAPGAFLDDEGALRAHLQLRTLAVDPPGSIRDLKEQEVFLLGAAQVADTARAVAWLQASLQALPAVVADHFGGETDVLLPHELFFPELLADPAATTVADFCARLTSPAVLEQLTAARAAQELHDTFAYYGLAAHAEALTALYRPSIRLVIEDEDLDPEDAADLPVGGSRLGGLPDLPPGTPWPTLGGVPLSFLAQIRLADLRGLPGSADLPARGMLSFFFDAEGQSNVDEAGVWQWPVRHRGGVQVLHFDADPEGFVRAACPEDLRVVFPTYTVACAPERLMPPMEAPFYEALEPDAEHDNDWYMRFAPLAAMIDGDPERPMHRLLGHTHPLQGDPYLEAEVYARGETFDGWQREGARERAILQEATQWRLLLQVDSEPDNTLLNQDGGFLYFLIREADLIAGRFDQVWGIAHGH